MELTPPIGSWFTLAQTCSATLPKTHTAPETVALRHLGISLTYREMGRAVSALARRIAKIVAPGEVVALVLPNSIEFHVAYSAALKALAVPALFHPLYPAAQLVPLLREVSPRAVICTSATRDMMASLARDLGIPAVVSLGQDATVPDLVAEPELPVGLRTATPADLGARRVRCFWFRAKNNCGDTLPV